MKLKYLCASKDILYEYKHLESISLAQEGLNLERPPVTGRLATLPTVVPSHVNPDQEILQWSLEFFADLLLTKEIYIL